MQEPTEQGSAAPVVSVILRNYNRADRIERALDSALAQSFPHFELLFVDDASTDDSVPKVASRYGDERRLKIITLPENVGPGGASNAGLAAARGRYIAFLDSDDIWFPEYLQSQVALMEQHPQAQFCYSRFFVTWEPDGIERVAGRPLPPDPLIALLSGNSFLTTQSVMLVRHQAFKALGGFNPRYRNSSDFDFAIRLTQRLGQPFLHNPDVLARYHISGDNVTNQFERWMRTRLTITEPLLRHPSMHFLRGKADVIKAAMVRGVLRARKARLRMAADNREPIAALLPTLAGGEAFLRSAHSIAAQTMPPAQILVPVRRPEAVPAVEASLASLDLPGLQIFPLAGGGPAGGDVAQEAPERAQEPDGAQAGEGPSEGRPPLREPSSLPSLAAACNAGLFVAQAPLVAFLVEGDEWLPDYLKLQARALSLLAPFPLFSIADYYDAPEPEEGRTAQPREQLFRPCGADPVLHQLFRPAPASLSTLAVRRRYALEAGGMNEQRQACEEIDLVLRLTAFSLARDIQERLGREEAPARPARLHQPLVRRRASGWLRAPAHRQALVLREGLAALADFLETEAGRPWSLTEPDVIEHFRSLVFLPDPLLARDGLQYGRLTPEEQRQVAIRQAEAEAKAGAEAGAKAGAEAEPGAEGPNVQASE